MLAPALADDGSSGVPTAPGPELCAHKTSHHACAYWPWGRPEEGAAWRSRSAGEGLRDSNRSLPLGMRSTGPSGQGPSAAAVLSRAHCTAQGGAEASEGSKGHLSGSSKEAALIQRVP